MKKMFEQRQAVIATQLRFTAITGRAVAVSTALHRTAPGLLVSVEIFGNFHPSKAKHTPLTVHDAKQKSTTSLTRGQLFASVEFASSLLSVTFSVPLYVPSSDFVGRISTLSLCRASPFGPVPRIINTTGEIAKIYLRDCDAKLLAALSPVEAHSGECVKARGQYRRCSELQL